MSKGKRTPSSVANQNHQLEPDDALLCEKLAVVLQTLNLTQEEAASRLQTKQNTISRIINKRNAPSLSLLRKILTEFELNPFWFILNQPGSMFTRKKAINNNLIDGKVIKNQLKKISEAVLKLNDLVG